jgi:hypothetical protein
MAAPTKKQKEAELIRLVKETMLNSEELKRIEKLRDKDAGIAKLLDLYYSFKDQILAEPMQSMVNYLQFAKSSLDEAMEYLSGDELVDVHVGEDEDGQPIVKQMPQKVAVMVDKQNGMPERFRDIGKNIKDVAIDVMEMVSAQRQLLNGSPTDSNDIPMLGEGFSFADHNASGRKKG